MSAVKLEVKNLGHVPALKNSMYAIVDPKHRDWKRRCVASFVSQLISACQTTGGETLTTQRVLSLTQSLPPDDAWQHIPVIILTAKKVKRGEEGAEILIDVMPEIPQPTPSERHCE